MQSVDNKNDKKKKKNIYIYLFSVVHAIDTSANDLNHDLEKISE